MKWLPIAEAAEVSHWGNPVLLHSPVWNVIVLVGGWDAHEQAWRVYGYGIPAAQPTHWMPLPPPPTDEPIPGSDDLNEGEDE